MSVTFATKSPVQVVLHAPRPLPYFFSALHPYKCYSATSHMASLRKATPCYPKKSTPNVGKPAKRNRRAG